MEFSFLEKVSIKMRREEESLSQDFSMLLMVSDHKREEFFS